MRIDERIASNPEPSFSFEFFPPRTDEGERNLGRALAELSRLEPTFVSVTYGAAGSQTERRKTIDIVRHLKRDYGMEAMAHFTCVGSTTVELREILDTMRDAGIENVLALRGDPPPGETEWTATEGGLSYSRELIELIRDEYDFSIGAACFPEVHIHATDAESDLRYLKEKVDAGARFLITQLFFDNQDYFDFVARARDIGIDVPIVPGIWPITNASQIRRVTELCGSQMPPLLMRELDLRADQPDAVSDLGVAYATLQCAELLANGAPGIHFYTLNRSPATRAILSALRLMAPWRGAVPGLAVALDVERVRHARLAVDLPGDVDLVVLAVRADAPGAPEPAPEAEPALLREVGVEDQHAVLDAVVLARLLADAVDEDGVGRADAARQGDLRGHRGHDGRSRR